jgi:hypothetical protein
MTPDEYAQKLNRIAKETIGPALQKLFVEASYVAEDKAKENLTCRVLRVRTDNLRASTVGFVRQEAGVVDVGVRAGGRISTGDAEVKYASLHEYGQPSILTPKKG